MLACLLGLSLAACARERPRDPYTATGELYDRAVMTKDAKGRIKRQAARFQIFVYDGESPDGRPLRLGDPVLFFLVVAMSIFGIRPAL